MSSSRIQDALKSIPLITLSLLILNVSIHGLIFLFSCPLNWFAISAYQVFNGQYYRIISAAFVHNGIFHLFMNMSSLIQLGLGLENRYRFGSLNFLFVTIFSVLASGTLYVFMSWILYIVLNDKHELYTSGVGFSGVLFCYATIESFHGGATTRSIFGMFNVPARIYPFVLLILLQVLIPGISFLGHLSGILIGIVISIGAASYLLPSQETLQKIESYSFLSRIVSQSNYVRVTNRSFAATSSSGMSMGATIYFGFMFVISHVCNLFGLIGHIIGCPVDYISSSCSKFWTGLITSIESLITRIYQSIGQLISPSSVPSSNEYTPLSTTESIQV